MSEKKEGKKKGKKTSAYNWPGLGMTGGDRHAPFETLVAGYRRQWQHLLDQCPIPLSPLPINGGWDSRPWHGDNHLVRFGCTPELFKRHLADARRFAASSPGATPDSSPIANAVLIEAWNEWGEGSYLEPHNEFGFGYLETIREVFTPTAPPHEDLIPADRRANADHRHAVHRPPRWR